MWAWCCDEAVSHVMEFHLQLGDDDNDTLTTKNGGKIQQWFRIWKLNSEECFPNPYFICDGKKIYPNF